MHHKKQKRELELLRQGRNPFTGRKIRDPRAKKALDARKSAKRDRKVG